MTTKLLTLISRTPLGKATREGMKEFFNGITDHLKQRGIATISTGAELPSDPAWRDSLTLQRATAEALALLTYLKRYAAPKAKA